MTYNLCLDLVAGVVAEEGEKVAELQENPKGSFVTSMGLILITEQISARRRRKPSKE